VNEDIRYGIQELAALGGVSRRTVRYYIQEGLLPPPLGLGRGNHYTHQHLERLLEVKALQERGLTIAQILRGPALDRAVAEDSDLASPSPGPTSAPLREAWVRLVLAPGMELHVSSNRRLPAPSRLQELVNWCQEQIPFDEEPQA
jgi:DNA-binding transcriptional MerR regulator